MTWLNEVLGGAFVDQVAEILTRYSMLPAGARIGVAVSGGADSVVLTHVLYRLSEQFEIRLAVLHVNHLLRGAASDQDEQFVSELAASLQLPLFSGRVALPPGNVEQEARRARRDFFARVRLEQGLERIALGHSKSDQAETVLLRLLRGSGTAGLAGMRYVTADHLIRPLLSLGRAEIRTWAVEEGIAWREDASNEEQHFARNRLRKETIPALVAAYNANLETVLARTATVAQAEEDYWEAEIGPVCRRIAARNSFGIAVSSPALRALQPAVQRRAVRHLIFRLRGDLRSVDLGHIDQILALCESTHGHDRVLIPGVDALRSFETMLLTAPGKLNVDARQYRFPLRLGEQCALPGSAGSLRFSSVKSEAQLCANFKSEADYSFEVAEINHSVLSDAGLIRPLYVRNWEPGDEIHRPGHSRPEKIKTLFGEHRILLWERRHWPVVVCGDEVVWVRRFGCSVRFKASGPEMCSFRIEYSRDGEQKEL